MHESDVDNSLQGKTDKSAPESEQWNNHKNKEGGKGKRLKTDADHPVTLGSIPSAEIFRWKATPKPTIPLTRIPAFPTQRTPPAATHTLESKRARRGNAREMADSFRARSAGTLRALPFLLGRTRGQKIWAVSLRLVGCRSGCRQGALPRREKPLAQGPSLLVRCALSGCAGLYAERSPPCPCATHFAAMILGSASNSCLHLRLRCRCIGPRCSDWYKGGLRRLRWMKTNGG